MKRNELVEKTIEPALQFFSKIKPRDEVTIIHGHDMDSICSTAICYTLAKEIFGADVSTIASQFNFTVTADSLERKEIKFTIFVDLADIPQEIFDRLNQFGKVLIVDHHPPKNYRDVYNSNPRIFQQDIYMPTSYVAYKIFEHYSNDKKMLLLSCLGTLADHGAKQNSDIFKSLQKFYPKLLGRVKTDDEVLFAKSSIGELVSIISSSWIFGRKSGAETALKALIKMKNPSEIFNSSFKEAKTLLNMHKKVSTEYKRVLKDFQEKKTTFGNIVFYEISSEMNLKSILASSVQKDFKEKIIAIAQKTDDSYDISFRRGPGVTEDLGQFAQQAIRDIPNASGGGHEAAAAARIPKEYIGKLLENLA